MGEVKRYDAVHIRYEDGNIRYGEGCEVEMVAAQDYDALRAENAELVAALVAVKNCIYRSDMVYSIAKKALAKHIGDK